MKSEDIKIDRKPTISEVLGDNKEQTPELRFLRQVEGVIDASANPSDAEFLSRLGPIASDYKMYLDRLSNAIDRSPKKIQTVDC
jgi:hypothetical protein